MSLATRIREARTERLALTQRELGEKLGIDAVNVSRWERGASEPRLENIRALAALCELPVSWFFSENSGEAAA